MTEPIPGAGPVDSVRVGTQIREWRIERFLARGGFGQVFAARRSSWVDGEPVRALKVFDPIVSSAARSSLISEFSVLRRVHHPHLISGEDAFDVAEGPLTGCVVFVMEKADTDLASEIARRGPLPLAEALDMGAQVAEGLAALHADGHLHGDVKPANILYVGDTWKLGDFGVSVTLQGSYALVQAATLDYRPPEVSRGEQGARSHRSSDVWAMGVTLWIAVTGQHPFVGSDPHLRYAAVLRNDRRSPSHLDPTVAAMISTRCLNGNPHARATAAELAIELQSLAGFLSARAGAPVPGPPSRPSASTTEVATVRHPGPTMPGAPGTVSPPTGFPLAPPPPAPGVWPTFAIPSQATTSPARQPVLAALGGIAMAAVLAEVCSLAAAKLNASLALRRTAFLVAMVALVGVAAALSRSRLAAFTWRVALVAAVLTSTVAALVLFGAVG